MTELAKKIEAVALGIERGDSKPAAAGRRLREIAAMVECIEEELTALLQQRGIAHPQAPYAPGEEAARDG